MDETVEDPKVYNSQKL